MRTALREASIALDAGQPSALALLIDLQTLLGDHLRQPLLDIPGPEQGDAFRCEPLFGDPHQLFERVIPGLAK
jgi:hypothetical protein